MPEKYDGKLAYSYDEIHGLVKQMSDEIKGDNISIDTIVAIATGGWIPSRIFRTFLPYKNGNRTLPLYSIGIRNYDSEDNLLHKPEFQQHLPALDLRNKTVLLVDEVADSGETLVAALDYLDSFKIKNVYSAVLHEKAGSVFSCDYVGEHMPKDQWIIYPWDQK